jgi:hypothetical protein
MRKFWSIDLGSYPRHLLLLALAVFFFLGLLTLRQTPPFEGPDEAQHYAYILWLAEGKGFPPQDDTAWETPIEQEASQPPLFYLLASLPARLLNTNDPPAVYRPNPHFNLLVARTAPDNDNRAVHYPTDGQPLRGGWLALYLARGMALLFGGLLLIAVYGAARQVTPGSYAIPLGVVYLTAVTPQFIYISSVASNDTPAAALSTLALWLLLLFVRRGGGNGLALALGAVFGLSVLAKVSAFILIVPIGLGWLWVWHTNGRAWKPAIIYGLLMGGSVFVVAGWWFIRAWQLYGSPLGLQTHDLTPWAIHDPAEIADFIPRWQEVFRSYWLAYGWGTIRPHGWVYALLGLATVIAGLGLVRAGWRWQQKPHTQDEKTTAAMLLILAAGLLTVMLFLEYWMHRVVAPYGRLLFPVLTATSLFLILGWRAIHPRLPVLLCSLIGLMALLGPFTIMHNAYDLPQPLGLEEISRLSPPLNIYFGPTPNQLVAELLSARPLESSVQTGNIIAVEICWRVLAQTERDYSILLHIIGPENGLLTNRRTYPGLGLYPTSTWTPGVAFCDIVRVPDWKTLPRTQLYRVEVALYDQQMEERIPAFAADGTPLAETFVNDIRLVVAKPEPLVNLKPELGAIQLLSYTAAASWQPGHEIPLTLKWGVAAPVGQDLQTFVHLRDPQSGNIIAQADGPPLAGWYPTSWWAAGETVTDDRSFPLPATMSPGTYDLVVGFYDLASGMRVGDEFFLEEITVEPSS